MGKTISRFFLNERVIDIAIILNVTTIFIEEYGIHHLCLQIVGYSTLLFFIGEMVCKQMKTGIVAYWKDGWNQLDGSLVIISLPSLLNLFFPQLFTHAGIMMTLRIFRVFRFFRLTHFFPNFEIIVINFKKALKDSRAIMLGYIVMILICALISCSLFGKLSPEFFGTPGKSIYSTFRLFTIEGWYEIPDTITEQLSTSLGICVRLYFCITLLSGGIIGLSLLNSIFVDAMVSDNNDEMLAEIKKLQKQVEDLQNKLNDNKTDQI